METWVQGLVTGMQTTMKAVIKRAARHVNELSLEEFLLNSPAQVALLGLQFQWTADTQASDLRSPCDWLLAWWPSQKRAAAQAALVASKAEKGVLVKALKKAEAVLKEMVGMTLRSNLTRIQRISLETCITIHMHQKESTGEPPPATPATACCLPSHPAEQAACRGAGAQENQGPRRL